MKINFKVPILSILFFLVSMTMNSQTLFDAQSKTNNDNWYIIDDVVMGGRSSGQIEFTKEGHANFHGKVSLENNGGFSSVRYEVASTKVHHERKIRVRLKGDGSRYQFRVRHQRNSYYSYTTSFETTGEWQVVEFLLSDLYPTFRGRRLDLPNFNHDTMEEITFLISNKRAQEFWLLVEYIELIP